MKMVMVVMVLHRTSILLNWMLWEGTTRKAITALTRKGDPFTSNRLGKWTHRSSWSARPWRDTWSIMCLSLREQSTSSLRLVRLQPNITSTRPPPSSTSMGWYAFSALINSLILKWVFEDDFGPHVFLRASSMQLSKSNDSLRNWLSKCLRAMIDVPKSSLITD